MEESIKNAFSCPITKLIMYDPVAADDGHIYERSAIQSWFDSKGCIDPHNFKLISGRFIPLVSLKEVIENYLDRFPEERMNQFQIVKNHKDNRLEVYTAFINDDYNKLLLYTKFNFKFLITTPEDYIFFKNFFRKCSNNNFLKYVIDNTENLEDVFYEGLSLIHFVCMYANPEIIKYLVGKDINAESCTNFKTQPIHYLCMNREVALDIVKLFVEKGANLESEDFKGKRPIHYLSSNINAPVEIFKYLLEEKNVDFNVAAKNGLIPLHYACAFASRDVIMYVLDNTNDPDVKSANGWRPIHALFDFETHLTVYEHVRTRVKFLDDSPENDFDTDVEYDDSDDE